MVETRTHRRVTRNRKKNRVPLAKLRTAEVVRTVVDHPKRLDELVALLDDSERALRGRAAATLARLSESHGRRLIRVVDRLRESLSDDSAYVRWHLVYTLGRLGTSFPVRAPLFLQELLERLEDSNRIVRSFSLQALGCMAARDPRPVEQLFASAKKDVPPPLLRILRASGTEIRKPAGK